MNRPWGSRLSWLERFLSIIKTINDEGVTILLVEQNARMALSISDVGLILENGRFVMKGKSSELDGRQRCEGVLYGDEVGRICKGLPTLEEKEEVEIGQDESWRIQLLTI